MKSIKFIKGSIVRQVFIDGKLIKILTPELNFVPFEIDLDKLDINDEKFKGMENLLIEVSQLKTEEDIANDFEKDFRTSGWRKME